MAWECEYYPSGTCIVTSRVPRAPHFYIYGPRMGTESETNRARVRVCEEIRDHMNGGPRPKWLDELDRRTEDSASDLTGISIRATGPSIDRNPPRMDWVEDASDAAQNARARLMDQLFGVGAEATP